MCEPVPAIILRSLQSEARLREAFEFRNEQGRVTFSYRTRYFNAGLGLDGVFSNVNTYHVTKTGEYHFGGHLLFDRDDWGPDVLLGYTPRPSTPEGYNVVFNRTGAMFHEAFGFVRLVGVKTCLGTETPLTIPKLVQERLKTQGKNPADPAVVREVYEGTFQRIAKAHPLDYYWLWTPESWTGEDSEKAERLHETIDDVKIARQAIKDIVRTVPVGHVRLGAWPTR